MSKISFNNKNTVFFTELRSEVDKYFQETKLKKTGNWRIQIKTAILIPLAVGLYASLLIFTFPVWVALTLCGILGLTLASIGFNVMHDACHGSFSSKKWVNNTLGLTLNALGGNAFFWKQKHNIIHHTYTNVDGVDDDIAKSPVIRQCETQKWVPMHRVQHIYLPLVYSITSLAWTFIMDFTKYFKQKIQSTVLQKMDLKEHIIFWVSKMFYVFFYVVLPILAVGLKSYLIGFAVMEVILGFTLAIVFQLAHVVEETDFDVAITGEDKIIEHEWAVHQLKTTANFATNNKIINWYVGGLNYQVEHHLFPKISHIHYPAISKIVQRLSAKHGLPYHNFPTMWSAVVSHFRFMKYLGQKPQQLSAA
jgi:linoleoyl-CoA desaturase